METGKYLTMKEVSEIYKISIPALRKMKQDGKLPCTQALSRKILIYADKMEEIVKQAA